MKNKLQDLNDHLFAQIERLNDETIKDDKMKLEIDKALAMNRVADQIVKTAKLQFDAFKFTVESDAHIRNLPEIFNQPQKQLN